jgi:hypothetical protein
MKQAGNDVFRVAYPQTPWRAFVDGNHTGERSGFIEDLPLLSADEQRAGAMRWEKPRVALGSYGKVALDRIEIFIDPSSPYKGVSPDDLKVIADTIHGTIAQALEPDYPVVGKTGPGVVYMRLALTNVLVKKKKRGLLSFTPIGFAVTTLQEVAGGRTSLKNAVFEAELIDGKTGERIGVLIDELGESGDKNEYTWDAVVAAADFYAKRFRARLDAAHKR